MTSIEAEVAARIRAGTALRQLGHALAGHDASADDLDAAADRLEALAGALSVGPARNRMDRHSATVWEPLPAHGEEMFSLDERPFSGRAAPLGLDMKVVHENEEAVGLLTLGAAHEGAPGRSHGGVVAALFDDLFGFVLTIEQTPAFTGELMIRYEAATPIGIPLECRVRLASREGRKLFMTGELTPRDDPSTVYARSRGTFITIEGVGFGAAAAAG